MDDKLKERLLKISNQIQSLYEAEETFLTLDAAKDHKIAKMVQEAPKELTSEVSKVSWVKSQIDWYHFRVSLAQAEAEFHKQKHLLDLKFKAYDAEHLTYKVEETAIKRGVE